MPIGDCPHSYPQVWTGQSSRSGRRSLGWVIGVCESRGLSAGSGVDQAPSLLSRVSFRSETALAEANSFRRFGPTVPQHCRRVLENCFSGRDGCDGSKRGSAGEARFDRAKTGQYPQTVARKSAIRQRTERCRGGTRRSASETKSLPTATASNRIHERTLRGPAGARTRRDCRGQGQADLPAQQPQAGPGTRVPAANAYPCGPRNRVEPAPQGPPVADCLTSARTRGQPRRAPGRKPDDAVD
ncbi:MAG: rnpA [Mycobacterium sp.]|nr:rnpA [Mycobacterium sp.]